MDWTNVLCVLGMLVFGVVTVLPRSFKGPLPTLPVSEPIYTASVTHDHCGSMGNEVLSQEVPSPPNCNPNPTPNPSPDTNPNPALQDLPPAPNPIALYRPPRTALWP